jgi:ADP-ribose pyrophosphatase YjhB (NUDIX family)
MTANTSFGFGTGDGRSSERQRGESEEVVTDGGQSNDMRRDAATSSADGDHRGIDSLTDPTAWAEREDVATRERTYTHEDPDHCEADAVGRAVLGVTNDDGEVLLLVGDDDSHAILPNSVVGSGEDWAAVGRRTVEESAGVSVYLESVEEVRTVEHEVETDGESRHQNTTRHVLFGASPSVASGDASEPVVTDDSDWTAGWYEEIAVEINEAGDVVDDIRAVIERTPNRDHPG